VFHEASHGMKWWGMLYLKGIRKSRVSGFSADTAGAA